MVWSTWVISDPLCRSRAIGLLLSFRRSLQACGLTGSALALAGSCGALLAAPQVSRAQDLASATALGSDFQVVPPATRTSAVAMLDPQANPAGPASARYAITPERRALLNTIRFSEGTWARGEDIGYRIMFGGGLMASLDRHPDRVIYAGGYASAAAGAYQFMPFTWAKASRTLQLNGFGPHVQDQAALFLIERRGALALADQGLFTPELAARLAPEWASFPTLAGNSYYGQPVQRYAILRSFYERNLAELRAAVAPVQDVAKAPACEPVDSLRCQLESLDRVGPRSRNQGS